MPGYFSNFRSGSPARLANSRFTTDRTVPSTSPNGWWNQIESRGRDSSDQTGRRARFRLRERTETGDSAWKTTPIPREVPVEIDAVFVFPRSRRKAVGVELEDDPKIDAVG